MRNSKIFFILFGLFGITVGYNACSTEYQILSAAEKPSVDALATDTGNTDSTGDTVILGEDDTNINIDDNTVVHHDDSSQHTCGRKKDDQHDEIVHVKDIDTTEDVEDALDIFPCKENGKSSKSKVLVCHIPPGNPEAQHEICVSINALPALTGVRPSNLHDYLGNCRSQDSSK